MKCGIVVCMGGIIGGICGGACGTGKVGGAVGGNGCVVYGYGQGYCMSVETAVAARSDSCSMAPAQRVGS